VLNVWVDGKITKISKLQTLLGAYGRLFITEFMQSGIRVMSRACFEWKVPFQNLFSKFLSTRLQGFPVGNDESSLRLVLLEAEFSCSFVFLFCQVTRISDTEPSAAMSGVISGDSGAYERRCKFRSWKTIMHRDLEDSKLDLRSTSSSFRHVRS
jgi:hypothetical protein